ncbi:Galactoside 2-alpha-L-fucosyltransferase [Zea mays]|uniref:Fucosyltransferase n=2 Tax=Zea mays TaxID=4577 RepID=A0A8J8XR79_MAIZE|nr:fucosyltransferase 7 [Zea mays]PWZ44415.1 Galactoside 2-alpha-L-fucosyltransferase [Zea mays]|eukprot:NP_001147440.1 fucosyltransferase 7 [Zea mays]
MDQKKAMRSHHSHMSPWQRGLAARRGWCQQAAARPTTVLVIVVTVFAALLLAVVLFGVRLTPLGANNTWVSAGVRVVLKAVSDSDHGTGPLATVPDPSDRLLGGLLSPDFDESSCLSRYSAALYRRPSLHAVSTYLVSALRRYESLHRRCGPGTPGYARAVELLRANASAAASSSSGSCSYAVWAPIEGLGNRMLSITSAFLYALLTDRVLLLHSSGGGGDLDGLFCEPFPGSTWILPGDTGFPIRGIERLTDRYHHQSLGSVLRRGEDPGAAPWLYVHLRHDYTKDSRDQQFFCDDVQARLGAVPWLVFRSDNYFVPGLFLVPRHEAELARMFPRRDVVFHHLGRYLFHPSDTVWGMVTQYHDSYFASADERVGIQVRRFYWAPISTDDLFAQILNCSQREDILPSVGVPAAKGGSDGQQPAKQKAVVVVSLHGEYSEKLRDLYQGHGGAAGGQEAVSVHQPTHLGSQRSGEQQHNQKALAEMVLLSFSDALVTSAVSTFGYVGQGLAGLRPWVLTSPVDRKGPGMPLPCRRAATVEPCFHAPLDYDCRAKAKGDAGRRVRHIRHCEDFPRGVQLVE